MPPLRATEDKSCVRVDMNTGVGCKTPGGHDENLSPAHGVCDWQMCQLLACPEKKKIQSRDKFLNSY